MSDTPKFKPGDHVILTTHQGESRRVVIHGRYEDNAAYWRIREIGDLKWSSIAHEQRLRVAVPAIEEQEAVAETPKFKPGDEVIVDDKTDTRHGQSLWLAERRVGLIARRPYWIARETPDGNPHIAITEDAIKAAAPKPVIPTLEERQASLRARSSELAGRPSSFDRSYDEWPVAEPPVGQSPKPLDITPLGWATIRSLAAPLHDGQAVTSCVKADPEPRGPSILREPFRWMSLGYRQAKLEAEPFARVDIADQLARAQTTSATPARPTTVTIVEGIERWRLLDPAHRRVSTQAGGHTVEVWITVLPSLVTHRTKFMMGDTAEHVAGWLSDLAKLAEAHPAAEISARMARNPPFRFYEDSGEIEP